MNNYEAVVTTISNIAPIEGADKIRKANILTGVELVVGLNVKEGDEVVYFEANSQVNLDLLRDLNLFSNQELNNDTSIKGYVSKNGRIKSLFLKGVKSEGMIIPLEQFNSWLKSKNEIPVLSPVNGTYSFSSVGNVEISKRYVPEFEKIKQENIANHKVLKKEGLHYEDFEEHFKTTNFKYAKSMVKEGDSVIITPKIHGTSFRTGWCKGTSVSYDYIYSWWKCLINFFLPDHLKLSPMEVKHKSNFDHRLVTGSRRVTLKDESKEGFHGSNTFRFDVSKMVEPLLKAISESTEGSNVVAYGEIYGYVNGKPIMPTQSTKNLPKDYKKKYPENMVYKYRCKDNEYRFKIYRLVINGNDVDYDVMKYLIPKEWMFEPVYRGTVTDFDEFASKVSELTERPDLLTEDYLDKDHISEGVIIRIERLNEKPLLLKSKSFFFLKGELEEEAQTIEEES